MKIQKYENSSKNADEGFREFAKILVAVPKEEINTQLST